MSDNCNLCSKQSAVLTSVFKIHKCGQVIADLIKLITQVAIKRNDKQSKFICQRCLEVIIKAYEIRIKSLQSDQKLRDEADESSIPIDEDCDASPRCRICLKETDDLEEIFRFRGGRSIASSITSICPIELKSSDKFSHEICFECLNSIDDACKLCKIEEEELEVDKIKEEKKESSVVEIEAVDVKVEDIQMETEDSLKNVIELQNGQQLFVCKTCQHIFTQEKLLNEHIALKHAKSNSFVCNIAGCGRRFDDRVVFDSHLKFQHKFHFMQEPNPSPEISRGIGIFRHLMTRKVKDITPNRRPSKFTEESFPMRLNVSRTNSSGGFPQPVKSSVKIQPKVVKTLERGVNLDAAVKNPLETNKLKKVDSLLKKVETSASVEVTKFIQKPNSKITRLAIPPVKIGECSSSLLPTKTPIADSTSKPVDIKNCLDVLAKIPNLKIKVSSKDAAERSVNLQSETFETSQNFPNPIFPQPIKLVEKNSPTIEGFEVHHNVFIIKDSCEKSSELRQPQNLPPKILNFEKLPQSTSSKESEMIEFLKKATLKVPTKTSSLIIEKLKVVYPCNLCDEVFDQTWKRTFHKRAFHLGLIPQDGSERSKFLQYCELCEKGFQFDQSYSRHMTRKHRTGNQIKKVAVIEIAEDDENQVTTKFKCNVPECNMPHKTRDEAIRHDQMKRILHGNQSQKPLGCEHCGHRTTSEKSLNNHIRTRHPEQWSKTHTFQCKMCGKVSRNSKSYDVHIAKCSLGNRFGCSFCNETFKNVNAMDEHIQTSHDIDPLTLRYECAHCSYTTTAKIAIEIHLRKIHLAVESGKVFQCDKCDAKFTESCYLRNHRWTNHGETFPGFLFCDICKYFGKFKTKMEAHMKHAHLDVKEVLCSVCGSGCESNSDLKLHAFLHSDIVEKVGEDVEQLLFCSICPFASVNGVDVMEHTEDHRGLFTDKIINCLRCPKPLVIPNFDDLLKHSPIHLKRKEFRCKKCQKLFLTSDKQFLNHIKTHYDEKLQDFKCTYCGKVLKSLPAMRTHVNTMHKKDRQGYLCSICGVTIQSRTTFKSHFERHTNSGAFKCVFPNCKRTFSLRNKLKYHIASHSIQRNLKCKYCDKVYKTQCSLRFHIRSEHESSGEKYPCRKCGFQFKRKYKRNLHEKENGPNCQRRREKLLEEKTDSSE